MKLPGHFFCFELSQSIPYESISNKKIIMFRKDIRFNKESYFCLHINREN